MRIRCDFLKSGWFPIVSLCPGVITSCGSIVGVFFLQHPIINVQLVVTTVRAHFRSWYRQILLKISLESSASRSGEFYLPVNCLLNLRISHNSLMHDEGIPSCHQFSHVLNQILRAKFVLTDHIATAIAGFTNLDPKVLDHEDFESA